MSAHFSLFFPNGAHEPWPQHQYQTIVQKKYYIWTFFSLCVFLILISQWHTGPPPGNEWMKTFKIGLHHPLTTGHADLEYITLQSWMQNSAYSEIQYLMWDCCAAGYLLLFKFHLNCYSHPHSVGIGADSLVGLWGGADESEAASFGPGPDQAGVRTAYLM